MTQAAKKKKPVTPVIKPYLKGDLTDSHMLRDSAKVFGMLAVSCFLFLFVSVIMMIDNPVLRVLVNSVILVIVWLIFYSIGAGTGTAITGRSEILLQRKERGIEVGKEDQASCFHPLKGYVIALIGTVPFFVLAVYLMLVSKKQFTGIGALPSWLSAYSSRDEVYAPLVAYRMSEGLSFEGIVRMLVRLVLMPWFSMAGSENKEGLVLFEKLSPVLILIPALFYGFGYSKGQSFRSKVHTDIAANRRKRAKKEKKERKARMAHTPEQLN